MADEVNDDVERALAAYGGTGFTYHTFGKFSLRPRLAVVTQMNDAPVASAAPAVMAARPQQSAAPAVGAPPPRVPVLAMSPMEVADAEAEAIAVPAYAQPLPAVPAFPPMSRPQPVPPMPSVTRQPLRPAQPEPVSRLAGVRARRAGVEAAPLSDLTPRFGGRPVPAPVPASAPAAGFHIDWSASDDGRDRLGQPRPPQPQAAPPAAAPDDKELFRRL